jgi:hypothetical protein
MLLKSTVRSWWSGTLRCGLTFYLPMANVRGLFPADAPESYVGVRSAPLRFADRLLVTEICIRPEVVGASRVLLNAEDCAGGSWVSRRRE